jgi:hypothetical protein
MKRHFQYASNVDVATIHDSIFVEVECSKVTGKLCEKMGVTGFPTVMLIYKGKSMKYEGGRTHGSIIQFLSDKSKWIMEQLPTEIAEITLLTEDVHEKGDDEVEDELEDDQLEEDEIQGSGHDVAKDKRAQDSVQDSSDNVIDNASKAAILYDKLAILVAEATTLHDKLNKLVVVSGHCNNEL